MSRTRKRSTATFPVAGGFALGSTWMVVGIPALVKYPTGLEAIQPPDPPREPGTTRDLREPGGAGRSQG